MPKRDITKPIIYLDSCVFIDMIELPKTHPTSQTIANVWEDAVKGRFNLVTSVLTISEVWHAKKELDRKAIDPKTQETIENLWHPSSPLQLVDVHELIVKDAAALLRDGIPKGWQKTKGNDAIHLVTAKREMATEFFTTEKAMRKWGDILGFKVNDPHWEPETPTVVEPEGSLFATVTQGAKKKSKVTK